MRISLSDELYWSLAAKAASCHMKPIPYLEKWLREEMARWHSGQDGKVTNLPHDSSRRKGTFSPVEIDQIKSLHRQGLSAGKIAREMNRGKSGVNYAINAMIERGELKRREAP